MVSAAGCKISASSSGSPLQLLDPPRRQLWIQNITERRITTHPDIDIGASADGSARHRHQSGNAAGDSARREKRGPRTNTARPSYRPICSIAWNQMPPRGGFQLFLGSSSFFEKKNQKNVCSASRLCCTGRRHIEKIKIFLLLFVHKKKCLLQSNSAITSISTSHSGRASATTTRPVNTG